MDWNRFKKISGVPSKCDIYFSACHNTSVPTSVELRLLASGFIHTKSYFVGSRECCIRLDWGVFPHSTSFVGERATLGRLATGHFKGIESGRSTIASVCVL